MKCNSQVCATPDSFETIRREFERGLRLQGSFQLGGMTVVREGEGIRLAFDVPGLTEEELAIVFEDGVLSISGERKSNLPEGAKTLHNTRQFGRFERAFKIPETFDPESVDAVLESGVLTIRLTKRPELQPRSISIRSA